MVSMKNNKLLKSASMLFTHGTLISRFLGLGLEMYVGAYQCVGRLGMLEALCFLAQVINLSGMIALREMAN